ncbi:glycosyltransferase [Flavobacteriaceae bacterium S356]|uniref:Glycosyltransferase n=1 Tax=Asprobacillus argus TaxID=3076534 RepID=A0ABU3LB94_9FLAO|nr:glycosyltransferase [Flavobacteriaceae bacterium S356]
MNLTSAKQHIFIIGSVWVEPKSSAAGSRMLQLIELFLTQGWEITFGTTSKKNANSLDLIELGVKEVSLKLNDESFDHAICKLSPSIVVFDRFMTEEQFGWRVMEQCPGALRILDTEDLHCLRKTRHEALKKGIVFSEELLLSSEIAKREIAAMYRCDFSLIISTYELQLLEQTFNLDTDLMYHLPFLYPKIDQEKEQLWKSFKEREHFISIGNFLHAPNTDATIQLKKHIWPQIRAKLPEAELHIYGAYPTQQVLEFNNEKEGFYVHGFIEDANEVIEKSRILLAPLRFGAGIKGKLTDAMYNGTPSVTTTIGTEGMHEELEWNGFVEDDPCQFVEKTIQLYSEQDIWERAQQNGVKIINSLYDKQKLDKAFVSHITHIQSNLKAFRKKNFIGSLFQHHTLQSTKYMSKWIEEKQRNQSIGGT